MSIEDAEESFFAVIYTKKSAFLRVHPRPIPKVSGS